MNFSQRSDDESQAIFRDVLNDTTLSPKAKSLLLYLIFFAEDGVFNLPSLVALNTSREGAVRRTLLELQKAGHIHHQYRQTYGRVPESWWRVFSTPCRPDSAAAMKSLNKEELATRLGVNLRAFENGMHLGSIPYLQIRKTVRFDESAVSAALDRHSRWGIESNPAEPVSQPHPTSPFTTIFNLQGLTMLPRSIQVTVTLSTQHQEMPEDPTSAWRARGQSPFNCGQKAPDMFLPDVETDYFGAPNGKYPELKLAVYVTLPFPPDDSAAAGSLLPRN